ncbi:O-linked N-acetylglucosamine transferase, SPINDLY family protein [Nostocaceae cyanobacterium CENA369]|uniref:protein O-GlcNAc transferase n=1 Tax=Dendronalium phyllosphericum CENA369 TaxID=1725256 RepID=A0A8J7LEZ9_9NOST|nr:O-linked N-acetylglucosamine transferase, SPINDLY family protein [Dendronalium phyllosphericum]MBH8574691.1 O-linked N-acetylglucosamine transferase, SPINDLY family protein [Dendronalium phyllosphericum CENA369]
MLSLTSPTQWHQRAEKYFLAGNYNQAASIYEEAITIEPDFKSYYWYLGLILLLQGQDVEAQTTWLMALMEGEPEQVEAWNSELVKILQTEVQRREILEEYAIAEKIRQTIKEIYPQDIHNLLNLLQLFIKLENYTDQDLHELGIIKILQSEPRVEVNLELLMEALESVLDHAPAHPSTLEFVEACLPYCKDNTQTLLITLLPAALDIGYSQKQYEIAVQLCELYLQISPNNAEVIGHLASLYQNAAQYEKGIETAKLFFFLVEELADKVFANRQILRGLMTAGGYWEESCLMHNRQELLVKMLIEENPTQLDSARVARLYNANFSTPYIEDNPIKNRSIQNQLMQICQANIVNYAREQVNQYFQGNLERKKQNKPIKKINIGYLSHCLRSHSVGWLARWLFQHHDRDKFQVNGYFINTNPLYDPLHEWYLTKVDKSYKSNKSLQLAEQIYQDEIDILIDLDSITLDTTCDVISLKPAPVQVTWLGWDASGIPAVDYFIADPYVLPESAQEHYSERIWRLPQTYVAVDGFEVSVPTVRRDQLEIPDDAVIYLCGQRGFKRHPDITRLQLKILKEVPNSYFLIKGISDEESIKNFFEELAEKEGIDSSKLRFLPIVYSESVHRANLGIADVVLDTYPYNGATTTLETLWMCIPMVTRVGDQFAARNSYTMMMNAGITEGIAWTDEEYVEWGIRLGKDEALRQQIAWKLKQSRKTSPLWNGKQFTREMETAYEQMWQRYIEG